MQNKTLFSRTLTHPSIRNRFIRYFWAIIAEIKLNSRSDFLGISNILRRRNFILCDITILYFYSRLTGNYSYQKLNNKWNGMKYSFNFRHDCVDLQESSIEKGLHLYQCFVLSNHTVGFVRLHSSYYHRTYNNKWKKYTFFTIFYVLKLYIWIIGYYRPISNSPAIVQSL